MERELNGRWRWTWTRSDDSGMEGAFYRRATDWSSRLPCSVLLSPLRLASTRSGSVKFSRAITKFDHHETFLFPLFVFCASALARIERSYSFGFLSPLLLYHLVFGKATCFVVRRTRHQGAANGPDRRECGRRLWMAPPSPSFHPRVRAEYTPRLKTV